MTQQVFSDQTQLAGIRQAIQSVMKDHALSDDRKSYWEKVLDDIGARIERAMARERAAKGERRE